MPAVYEIQHLRRAYERLEGLGGVDSPSIDNLKRIVLRQIAELEASIDQSLRVQASPEYEPEICCSSL
jgi:hypothetical protein